MALNPRPLPTETVHGLRPPPEGYPFFHHADHFPFEPFAQSYSPANAWWLADASLLVYGEAAFLESEFQRSPLPALGFRIEWLGTRDANRGMVLIGPDAILVVFRGTRVHVHQLLDTAELVILNQDDLWIDSQFIPQDHRTAGKVHAGFRRAFEECRADLDRVMETRRPEQAVWLTGHSLGGALATLAAAHLGRRATTGLYTFGSPRVGNSAFVAELPTRAHYRIVHRDDWIPTLPPEFLSYVHGGTVHTLTSAVARDTWNDLVTGFHGLADLFKTMALEAKLQLGKLPFTIAGLADHAPVYYATLLWNALVFQHRRDEKSKAKPPAP